MQKASAQAPTAAFDVSDSIICPGNSVFFTDVSTPGGAAIVSTDWDLGDGSTSTQSSFLHIYSTGGNYTVTLIVTDALNNKDTITHVIYVLIAQAIQHTVRICAPQTTTSIISIDPNISGVSGTWFTASSAVIASPGNDTTTISNLISGSYLIFWVVSDGTCSDADQVLIIVDQPVVANAGPDQQICTTSATATMAANNPSPGTGQWTTSSTATITNTANRNTTITGLSSPGTYVFFWTITNGSCSTKDTMQIIVSDPVAANAGVDQLACNSNPTATLSGNNPSPGTGNWSTTGSSIIANPSNSSTSVSALANGNNTFIWTITNGGCITRDTMLVVVSTLINSNAGNNLQVCTSTGTATLSGNNPSPGTGVWSALNGGTIANINSNVTTVSGLITAGFYNFVWTITNGGCVSRDTMLIIVRAPVAANAGIDQLFCNVFTTTLSGNSPAPGSALWTTTGTSTINTPTSASTTVSNLSIGNNTFVYSTTFGACISRDTIIVHVDSLINANAGPDQQICESTPTTTLAGNNPSPGSGIWTKLNSGTITTPSSPVSTVTGLLPGVNIFIWSITNGACTSRDTMRITVNVQVAANAGIDDEICQGETTSLSGNFPLPAIGLWTTTSTATIATPSNSNTSVSSFINAGIYSFVWTVTNGACVLRDTVRITVDSLVIANAGTDQEICSLSTATISGNNPSPGSGLWVSLGPATIVNANNPTTAVNNLVYGNNSFVWIITNNNCSSRDTIVVRRDSIISANAGIDQQLCSSTGTVLLTGNNPSPGSGIWSTTGAALIFNPSSQISAVSGLNVGANTFIWTISNGSCISRDTVILTVSQNVIAAAGNDQVICGATSATLAANNPSPGAGIWTTPSAAIITSPSSPTSTVTGLISGTYNFIWTITNGPCITTDTVKITIDSLINANAGTDQQICSGTIAALTANTPSSGSGLWTSVNGGTITSPSNSSTTITGLNVAGIYQFVWTITNGSCISRDTVDVVVNQNVISNAGNDQVICGATIVTLDGNNPVPGSGIWTTSDAATITIPSSPTSTVTGLVSGTYNFIWTITNGTCISQDTVRIFIDSLITANAGIDQHICSGNTASLTANSPSSGSGLWSALNGGSISNPSNSTTTINGLILTGSYQFVWTIINGSCTSSDTVLIIVDSLINANAGNDQSQCELFTATLAANNSGTGTGTWSTTGPATVSNTANPSTTVSGLQYGMNTFIWTIVNGTCSSADTIVVNVDSIIPTNAGSDQHICASLSSIVLNANDPSPGLGVWTTNSIANIVNPNLATTSANGLINAGTYEFIWTVSNSTCIISDTLVVIVDSAVVANAGSDQQFCETQTATNLAAIPVTLGTGTWTTSSSATIVNPSDPTTLVNNLAVGSYQFIWTVTNGNCQTSDTMVIDISSLGSIADAGSDDQYCESATGISVKGNNPVVGSGTWSSLGTAIVDSPSNFLSTVSNLSIGQNLFVWTITNGACISNDTTIIVVNANPIVNAGADQYTTSGTPVNLGGTPTASSGTPPYTYAWSQGVFLNDSIISNPIATVFTTQIFNITVADSLGCEGVDTVIVYVNNPPSAQNDTLTINEDSVVVIVPLTNDTDPDSNLNPGSVQVVTGPQHGSVVVNASTGEITYTPNANYFGADSILYAVCDSGMPVYCDTAWIFINILPINDAPNAVDDIVSTPEDSCIQISILANDLDVENGIVISSVVIVSGPTHGTATIDLNTGIITYCPDSNFFSTDTIVYTVCDNGIPVLCDSALVIINVIPKNDPPQAVNDSITLCSVDSAIINILGNDFDSEFDPLTVNILSGPYHGSAIFDLSQQIIYHATAFYNGLDSIAYQVCDNGTPQGCDTAWVYITVHGSPQITSTVINSRCFGDSIGAIDISLIGNNPYTYNWSNFEVTQDIDSLIAGIYTVLVTDTFGCTIEKTDTIFGPASPLSAIMNLQPVLCYGDSLGAIDLQPQGGTFPYNFLWNTNELTEDIDSLLAGIYNVQVTDSNGCIFNITDTIKQPSAPLTASILSTNIICAGTNTGALNLTVNGGTPNYSFLWNDNSTNQNLLNVGAGIYTVLITDNYSCTLTLSDSIRELNPPIQSVVNTVSPKCLNGNYGDITIAVSGGLAPYQYLWSTGDLNNSLDSLFAGSYTVTVTDSLGCNFNSSITIADSSDLTIVNSGNNVICSGTDVTLSVPSYSGISYQWLNNGSPMLNDTTNQLLVNQTGNYSIQATAICGTYTAGPTSINVNTLPLIIVTPAASITCDSVLTLTASGGINYSWTPAILCTTPNAAVTTIQADQTITFVVTVSDNIGCSSEDSVLVTVTCDTIFVPSGFSPNGDGVNDFFVISNLQQYPDATLRIFNRWGNLVYVKDNYDNSWNGFSNSDKIRLGSELPDGTYYYIFESGKDDGSKSGYVILRR